MRNGKISSGTNLEHEHHEEENYLGCRHVNLLTRRCFRAVILGSISFEKQRNSLNSSNTSQALKFYISRHLLIAAMIYFARDEDND